MNGADGSRTTGPPWLRRSMARARAALPRILKWSVAILALVLLAVGGAELVWRATRVGSDLASEGQPAATPAPPAAVTDLRAKYSDGLLELSWEPPEGAKETLVHVSPDAYLGGGLTFTSKNSASMVPAWSYQGRLSGKARKVVVAPPPGALYFISIDSRVATDWPGANLTLTIPATATVTLTAPATGRVGRVLSIEGEVSVPPGALPARGTVRVLADLKDTKTGRWTMVREERALLAVGRAVGAESTFRRTFRPDRAGWWRFRVIRFGDSVGITWARRAYISRAARVR